MAPYHLVWNENNYVWSNSRTIGSLPYEAHILKEFPLFGTVFAYPVRAITK